MTTTCPFCGAALRKESKGYDDALLREFRCGTFTRNEQPTRGGQSTRCYTSEVARLTKERDEAMALSRNSVNKLAEVARKNCEFLGRIKRLEDALTWYEETVGKCQLEGPEGRAFRDQLCFDQGRRAKQAKEAKP